LIHQDGTVSNVRISKGLGYGCDEEALRFIELTNKRWKFSKNKTDLTNVRKILPIRFIASGK
jgi:protein TonB